MSDADSDLKAEDQAELNALLKPFIERNYPQGLFFPALSAEQVLATLTAIEERYSALDPLAQALLCEATRQLIIFNSRTQSNNSAALFSLSELVETLDLDPKTAKEQVYEALKTLAGLQLMLIDGSLPSDTAVTGTAVTDEATLQSFSVVWRSSLRYSAPDEDYLVTLVFSEEVMPLLRFAVSLQDDAELLPDWLRCDGRRVA